MKYLTTFISALLAGLAMTAGHAAEEQEPPLYRVELVVFVHTGGGTGEESWPLPQGLAYPDDWRILDADQRAAIDFGPAEAPEQPEIEPAAPVLDTTAAAADGDDSSAAIDADPDRSDDASPAWRSLPESDWLLADSAARLARSGRYRVVLHEAWLQPLGNRERNPALIVAGGERFGDHHELEGFLSLRQERYIHVDAELWLSRFRFGSSLEATLSSPLPTPPQLTRSTVWSHWFGDRGPATGGTIEPVAEGGASGDSGWLQSAGPGAGFGYGSGFSTATRLESNYVPSQIVVLKQRQRVEPDQLTYLDHPMLGALLLVKPLPAETD